MENKFHQNVSVSDKHNWQLLDEVEQNIMICQLRADQLFAEAKG